MKTFAKRFFPIILMCLMVCTIFPTGAFAAEAACHFCGVTCSYTVDYEPWTDKVHCVRHWCSNCGLDMCGGVLGEDHTMSNGVCTKCGYDDGSGIPEPEPDPEPDVCDHSDTYRNRSGCDWSEYCSDCGEYLSSGTSHGSYSYGAWEYSSTSRHRRYYSCDDCGYSTTEYGSHSDTDNDGKCDSCGYEMSYFSVTVPAVMMLAVSETGEVTAATNAVIINNSSAAVVISDITILSADGWTIVPYETNMADEKVNSNLIGFCIENIRTTDSGDSESFAGNWTLDSGDTLPLAYDAVVSAVSHAITDEQVLTVIFVIGWAA